MTVVKCENSLLPTFILTDDSRVSDIDKNQITSEGDESFTCFVLLQKGPYIYKGVEGALDSLTPAENLKSFDGLSLKDLEKSDAIINWDSKLSFDQFMQCQRFFLDIFLKYKTEGAVVLYYHPTNKDWKILYPIQVGISGGAVTYIYNFDTNDKLTENIIELVKDDEDKMAAIEEVRQERKQLIDDGYLKLGTIHSHCDFSAFHSGVDDDDEAGFDGLHITVGNLVSGLDYAQRVMGNGYYLKIENIYDVVDVTEDQWEVITELDDIENPLADFTSRCFDSISQRGFKNHTSSGSPKNSLVVCSNYDYDWWLEKATQTHGIGYGSGYSQWGYNRSTVHHNHNHNYQTYQHHGYEPEELLNETVSFVDAAGASIFGMVIELEEENDGYWIETSKYKHPIFVLDMDINYVDENTPSGAIETKSPLLLEQPTDTIETMVHGKIVKTETADDDGLTWFLQPGQTVQFRHTNNKLYMGEIVSTKLTNVERTVMVRRKHKNRNITLAVPTRSVIKIYDDNKQVILRHGQV